jgi:A/G-specific adenine glycosylase
MKLAQQVIQEFQQEIWSYYDKNKRVLPWRNVDDPYKVVISEIMLQQTQVVRVLRKYEEFLAKFPTFQSLAHASTHDLLSVWKGLGYNRRGLYLQKLAQTVVHEFEGLLPREPDVLLQLPGVGKATASSIAAFAYNTPTLFIETNIRTVFLYFFFKGKTDVHDKDILPLVEQTLDRENPREWYYALMDYGVMLKSTGYRSLNQISRQYVKQSKFEGSKRQIRGKILEQILKNKSMTLEDLKKEIVDVRLESVLEELVKEKFLVLENNLYLLR